MLHASIGGIEYFLPQQTATTAELAAECPEWGVESIDSKTGISERHIAAAEECVSDLACMAARKLFASGCCTAQQIDFILLCTETPDYLFPPTACLVQERLGIPSSAGALDFNLGSSGYVYGLGLAQGLIASGQARNILLLTGDTYSKIIHPRDRSVRTIFGDAACATLVSAQESTRPWIGPFVYGTNGQGAENLLLPAGGMRMPLSAEAQTAHTDEQGNTRSAANLYMNGMEIFTFTISAVPGLVEELLTRSGETRESVDLFVFHQANQMMLDHLRKRARIPPEKFVIALRFGNTVSCTIPIALKQAQQDGKLRPGMLVMLVGFGVGYSWGATLVRWPGA